MHVIRVWLRVILRSFQKRYIQIRNFSRVQKYRKIYTLLAIVWYRTTNLYKFDVSRV